MTPELEQEIRDAAASKIAEGFDPPEQIIEAICDVLGDDAPTEDLRPLAAAATAEALAAHLAAQREWPIPTDCDRLDRAFAALERDHIVARQNFTCCQSCGHAEIGDEIDDRRIEGYAFYHMQDTESAAAGGGLFLAYGAVERGAEAAIAVGRKIVGALEREGLTVRWNGAVNARIFVELDWKRRRST